MKIKTIKLVSGELVKLDPRDYFSLKKHTWYAHKTRRYIYAIRYEDKTNRRIFMHREILDLKTGDKKETDHINHDTLDNRRSNLRKVSVSFNQANRIKYKKLSSIYKGVHYDMARLKWVARIKINGKKILIGRFDSEKMAALAYDTKAKELFGKHAFLNSQT